MMRPLDVHSINEIVLGDTVKAKNQNNTTKRFYIKNFLIQFILSSKFGKVQLTALFCSKMISGRIKMFRYSFLETIPTFFNRVLSDHF